MSEAAYRRMFLGAAAWNLVGGLVLIVATDWIFAIAGLIPPDPSAYYFTWLAMVLVFGLGYHMVYRDMYANRGIVVLGVIGKLAFAVIFLTWILAIPGRVPWLFSIAAVGDLYFVVRFVMFLRFASTRRA